MGRKAIGVHFRIEDWHAVCVYSFHCRRDNLDWAVKVSGSEQREQLIVRGRREKRQVQHALKMLGKCHQATCGTREVGFPVVARASGNEANPASPES